MSSRTEEALANARELISARRYSEAVRACRRVLLSQPHDVAVRLLLGQALLAMGRHDEVRIEMLALLKRAPEVGAVHRMLGEAYMRGDKLEDASASLRTALHLDPNDDEARDLLEEVGEVDAPPKIETVDRWFAEPQTVEKSLANLGPAPPEELEFDDATVDRAPSLDEEFEEATVESIPVVETSVSKSVELDPEFLREMSEVRFPLEGEATQIPSLSGDELPAEDLEDEPTVAPLRRAPRPTALGLGPKPKSSMPPPPPGLSRSPIARPPTASGIPSPADRSTAAGIRAPAPERPGFGGKYAQDGGDATAELSSIDLDSIESSGTGVLDADDLLSIDDAEELGSHDLLGGGTAELSAGDLEPATNELGSVDLEMVGQDPYESMGALAPLEGEATHARAPLSAGPAPTMPKPPSSPPQFEDQTANAKGGRSSNPRPAGNDVDEEMTAMRPAVADFPEDDIDTGLPPLAGEETHARAPASGGSDPFGALAATATPIGHPLIRDAVTVTPIGHPTVNDPPSKELVAAATNTPITPQEPTGLRAKLEALKSGSRWPPGVLAALFGVPVLLVALIIFGVSSYQSSQDEAEVRAAARHAADEGTLQALREVLELDADIGSDEGPANARRALLYSMAVIEHGAPESARAQELLNGLEPAEAQGPNARIAKTYLALEAGRIEEAAAAIEPVPALAVSGEADYARALLELARSDFEGAINHARSAQMARSNAPRYAALLSRLQARTGDASGALQLANQIPQNTPTAQVAKIFALQASGRESDAKQEAEAVLALPEATASRRQRAFAELGLATALRELGEPEEAAASALRARELGPQNSEEFLLSIAEVQNTINHLDDAKSTLEMLPEAVANAGRRSLVSAEIFLAANDTDSLARALETAPDSTQTAYLTGRLHEARGALARARDSYLSAALGNDPVPSLIRLGGMALRDDDADEALEHLEPASQREPGNPEVTLLLVRAHLENDDLPDALAAVERAGRANPDDLRIRGARAEVEMARGQFDDAFRTFSDLATRLPGDADVHASLGRAALLAGEFDDAQTAYSRALELVPTHRRALLGNVTLALEQADVDAAESAIEAAEAGGVDEGEIAKASARLQVVKGEGARAVRALNQIIGRRSNDVQLLLLLGAAQLQAEESRAAIATYERVGRLDEGNFEAMLGLAKAQLLRSEFRPATRHITEAEQIAQRRDLGGREQSQIAYVRGRIQADLGNTREALALAATALEKDPQSSEAHLLRALIADYQGENALEHLQAAVAARTPSPEAVGLLALATRSRRERCDMRRRYLRAAPSGIDARRVRRLRCPR